MVDNNLYVENPANKYMHNGNKPLVGVLNLHDIGPVKKLYSYSDGEKLYNNLEYDIWQDSKKAKPKKRGIPLIIKLGIGIAVLGGLIFGGFRGIKSLFAKFKH